MVYRGGGGGSGDVFNSPSNCDSWCGAYIDAGSLEARDPYYIKWYDYLIAYPTNRVQFSEDGISLDPQIYQMTIGVKSQCLRMKIEIIIIIL